jgi:hypothetical protein
VTATELAASAGYPNFHSGNEKFVKLSRMFAENLESQPDLRPDESPNWISTLATVFDLNDGDWRWTMRPEVADCLVMIVLGQAATNLS